MSIAEDIQKLDAGAIVSLYELDATALGGSLHRFHAGTNELNGNITWDGNEYTRYPIEVSGYEKTSQGIMPRPTFSIGNKDGLVSALVGDFNDLVGAKVTRIKTFVKYIDAVNFLSGVNADADPSIKFDDEVFYVSQKVSENKQGIIFELSSAVDVAGILFPRRQVTQTCMWVYRDENCGYAGGAVADINDEPTTDINLDQCSRCVRGCELRFGEGGVLRYGGFISAGINR